MALITRTLTAAGLALCLAIGTVTASATPARANNNDQAAALIGGLIALYVIGKAIDRHGGAQAGVEVRRHQPQVHQPQAHRPQVHRPPQQHRPRQLVAPARCFIDGTDSGGYFRGYVRRCMQNNAARPDLLPQRCLRRVDTHRGPRMIYAGRCLAQNGWVREAGFRP